MNGCNHLHSEGSSIKPDYMIRRFATVLFLLFLLFSARSHPTSLSSFGQDFYLAYAPTSMDCTALTPFQSYWILISAPYDCNATISYFDQTTGVEVVDRTVHI